MYFILYDCNVYGPFKTMEDVIDYSVQDIIHQSEHMTYFYSREFSNSKEYTLQNIFEEAVEWFEISIIEIDDLKGLTAGFIIIPECNYQKYINNATIFSNDEFSKFLEDKKVDYNEHLDDIMHNFGLCAYKFENKIL